jgi:hypothetical protein
VERVDARRLVFIGLCVAAALNVPSALTGDKFSIALVAADLAVAVLNLLMLAEESR